MTITSLRLSYEEMRTLLRMMNISTELLDRADRDGEASVGALTVRKTRIEGLFVLIIATREN